MQFSRSLDADRHVPACGAVVALVGVVVALVGVVVALVGVVGAMGRVIVAACNVTVARFRPAGLMNLVGTADEGMPELPFGSRGLTS